MSIKNTIFMEDYSRRSSTDHSGYTSTTIKPAICPVLELPVYRGSKYQYAMDFVSAMEKLNLNTDHVFDNVLHSFDEPISACKHCVCAEPNISRARTFCCDCGYEWFANASLICSICAEQDRALTLKELQPNLKSNLPLPEKQLRWKTSRRSCEERNNHPQVDLTEVHSVSSSSVESLTNHLSSENSTFEAELESSTMANDKATVAHPLPDRLQTWTRVLPRRKRRLSSEQDSRCSHNLAPPKHTNGLPLHNLRTRRTGSSLKSETLYLSQQASTCAIDRPSHDSRGIVRATRGYNPWKDVPPIHTH